MTLNHNNYLPEQSGAGIEELLPHVVVVLRGVVVEQLSRVRYLHAADIFLLSRRSQNPGCGYMLWWWACGYRAARRWEKATEVRALQRRSGAVHACRTPPVAHAATVVMFMASRRTGHAENRKGTTLSWANVPVDIACIPDRPR